MAGVIGHLDEDAYLDDDDLGFSAATSANVSDKRGKGPKNAASVENITALPGLRDDDDLACSDDEEHISDEYGAGGDDDDGDDDEDGGVKENLGFKPKQIRFLKRIINQDDALDDDTIRQLWKTNCDKTADITFQLNHQLASASAADAEAARIEIIFQRMELWLLVNHGVDWRQKLPTEAHAHVKALCLASASSSPLPSPSISQTK